MKENVEHAGGSSAPVMRAWGSVKNMRNWCGMMRKRASCGEEGEFVMSKQEIVCSSCEHCKEFRRDGNTRSSFFCKHPDYEYIRNYFKEHRIQKMAGFIGFGKRWLHVPGIKTSPAWCPKKKEGISDEKI